ncbi:MAG: hypothetical protein O2819_08320 [Planctomycetota bacterium]|nr:hypothetical protein [Planctomycetota bacterium]MDA1106651.1 hypothetical protein [Planctomycetota bacterium]
MQRFGYGMQTSPCATRDARGCPRDDATNVAGTLHGVDECRALNFGCTVSVGGGIGGFGSSFIASIRVDIGIGRIRKILSMLPRSVAG